MKYKVIEMNESASLEIKTVSGCDAQPWYDEDTEESIIEEAIMYYYYDAQDVEVSPHYYASYLARWEGEDGEEVEKVFVVRYEEEEEEEEEAA